MGHIESGGEAAGSKAEDVWGLWKRLIRHFPAWSLIPSSFYTPGAFGYLGVDFVTGFRANRSTNQAFDLLDGVDDTTFDALSALANLNARRQDQMLRAVVIAYLTVPITVLAIVAEVAGDGLVSFVRGNMTFVVSGAVGVTMASLSYYLSHWRSRQIVGVLDLIRIERGQSPFTALELRED